MTQAAASCLLSADTHVACHSVLVSQHVSKNQQDGHDAQPSAFVLRLQPHVSLCHAVAMNQTS